MRGVTEAWRFWTSTSAEGGSNPFLDHLGSDHGTIWVEVWRGESEPPKWRAHPTLRFCPGLAEKPHRQAQIRHNYKFWIILEWTSRQHSTFSDIKIHYRLPPPLRSVSTSVIPPFPRPWLETDLPRNWGAWWSRRCDWIPKLSELWVWSKRMQKGYQTSNVAVLSRCYFTCVHIDMILLHFLWH